MEWREGNLIIDKELNKLDLFTIDFLEVWSTQEEYLLVSGYVSILTGRSRISEDINILVPHTDFESFVSIHKKLSEAFWCLNENNLKELYSLLTSGHSIRYAKKDKVIPNMKVKFIKTHIDDEAFKNKIKVKLKNHTLFISPLELQIIYKEQILKSTKDNEDALHLREVFKDNLRKEKLEYYEQLIK